MATYQELSEAVQKGNAPKAKELTVGLLEGRNPAEEILNKGLLDGMDKVGQKFKCNEIYIPEVLIAARAMNASMEVLKPELVKAGVKPVGKMLLGTVKGDLHDIGKNLVKMMAQGAGIDVVDLGIDVSPDKFVQGLKDNPDARTIGMSALLTTTMTGMKEVIDRFQKEGLRKKVKFVVGGAPLDGPVRARDRRGRLCAGRRQRLGKDQGIPQGIASVPADRRLPRDAFSAAAAPWLPERSSPDSSLPLAFCTVTCTSRGM